MRLNEAVSETKKISSKMPPPKWGIYQRFTDLVEEIGELSNAIQVEEGYRPEHKRKSELVDAICDILYEVFVIAAFYKVDLDKDYPKILSEIDDRRKKGEFNHKS